MTGTIIARNVTQALGSALVHFAGPRALTYPSRNGPMIEMDTPFVTTYLNPRERVVFCPVRDAHPFFHFFESLWMLCGRNDLAFPMIFLPKFSNFSDDGPTLNGAYGYRWRNHFGKDQLEEIISHLKEDPMSRRAVLQMWDPEVDFPPWSKDHPCNVSVFWRLREDVLDMTVTNRSNDALWGCYGANAVHFSYLHEYVAEALGALVGSYVQFSNSLHIYPEVPLTAKMLARGPVEVDLYESGEIEPGMTLFAGADKVQFDNDLEAFFHHIDTGDSAYMNTPFFRGVVEPMWEAWRSYKDGDMAWAQLHCDEIQAPDWSLACSQWIQRRIINKAKKAGEFGK